MQNHKIETNSELICEDGSIWSNLIFIKIIGSDTLWFPLPPSEVLWGENGYIFFKTYKTSVNKRLLHKNFKALTHTICSHISTGTNPCINKTIHMPLMRRFGTFGLLNFMTADPSITIIWAVYEISNNVVRATSKGSNQPAHTRSLIRAFASCLNILWLLSYWRNIIWSF